MRLSGLGKAGLSSRRLSGLQKSGFKAMAGSQRASKGKRPPCSTQRK